jgi:hypothetical protein
VKLRLALGFSLLLFFWGCHRGMETKEAVRQGVVDHLSSRTGLSVASMQIDVLSVAFRGNEADTTVSFRPKGGGEGMQMNYTLERKGDRWMVKGRAGSTSGMPHGSAVPPPGAMGTGLPAGHPPVPKSTPSDSKK